MEIGVAVSGGSERRRREYPRRRLAMSRRTQMLIERALIYAAMGGIVLTAVAIAQGIASCGIAS